MRKDKNMTSLKTFLQFTLNFPIWAKMLQWPGYPLIEENQTKIHNTQLMITAKKFLLADLTGKKKEL